MALESALNPFAAGQYIIPLWLIWTITIWDLVWRVAAVWRSTIKKQPVWSVVFVLFQTLGILPILYIFIFSKMKKKDKGSETAKKKRRK